MLNLIALTTRDLSDLCMARDRPRASRRRDLGVVESLTEGGLLLVGQDNDGIAFGVAVNL